DALGEAIRAVGGRCLLARPGGDFARVGESEWCIDPGEPSHVRRLLEETSPEGDPCSHVVHMWALDVPPPEQSPTSLLDAQLLSCGTALHLVHALASAST